MLTDIINILHDVYLRHKGVRTFKYQSEILNNAQGNNEGIQVYVSSTSYGNLNITTNIFTLEFQCYILQQYDGTPEDLVARQDECVQVAVDVLGMIDYDREYRTMVKLHDYSIITLDHYTDDDSCGARLSMTLEIASPLNLCELEDNFNETPYEKPEDNEITLPNGKDDDEITLVRLKRHGK